MLALLAYVRVFLAHLCCNKIAIDCSFKPVNTRNVINGLSEWTAYIYSLTR